MSTAFLFVLALAGCASPDRFGGSRQAVETWAQPKGFVSSTTGSAVLPLLALTRSSTQTKHLHVYIEGDGAPWLSSYHPPRDPTPEKPVALSLAAQDPAAVVYLGRPCQYLDASALAACPAKYWTNHRYAPEVIASYQLALDAMKVRHGAERIWLAGYSGGGAIALLLAGRRSDVEQVVTIASPISVAEWAAWHQLSPLDGSLDPATRADPLPPNVHFVGSKDRVVPAEVVAPFAAKRGGRLIRVPDFDHECCWSRDWQRLLEELR